MTSPSAQGAGWILSGSNCRVLSWSDAFAAMSFWSANRVVTFLKASMGVGLAVFLEQAEAEAVVGLSDHGAVGLGLPDDLLVELDGLVEVSGGFFGVDGLLHQGGDGLGRGPGRQNQQSSKRQD